jgi:hypothetical protein
MKLTALLLAAATLTLGPASIEPCAAAAGGPAGFACCKRCSAGKACGDSCIARDKVCRKGKGCACNG